MGWWWREDSHQMLALLQFVLVKVTPVRGMMCVWLGHWAGWVCAPCCLWLPWLMQVLSLYWWRLDGYQNCLHFGLFPSLPTQALCWTHLALHLRGYASSLILLRLSRSYPWEANVLAGDVFRESWRQRTQPQCWGMHELRIDTAPFSSPLSISLMERCSYTLNNFSGASAFLTLQGTAPNIDLPEASKIQGWKLHAESPLVRSSQRLCGQGYLSLSTLLPELKLLLPTSLPVLWLLFPDFSNARL